MAQCTSALEQVSAVQARTQMMAKSVADGIVRAPFDGVVSEKMVTPGEWVAPGKPLFTLVDDDPLKVELSISEVAVTSVKDNQRVEIVAVAHPDKTYGATITRLGAEIGRTRSLIVDATIDKGSELVPGMFVEAHIKVGETPRPVLPADAVAKRGKTWPAFVIKNGEQKSGSCSSVRRRGRVRSRSFRASRRARKSSRKSPTRSSMARRSWSKPCSG